MAAPGVYVLVLEASARVSVGRLGLVEFDGWYLYVGSARGPGGLSRVRRHFQYASRRDPPARWHIDRLLGIGALRGALLAATDADLECELSEATGAQLERACLGFGASDCGCRSHLYAARSEGGAIRAGRRALRAVGLTPRGVSSLAEVDAALQTGRFRAAGQTLTTRP